MGSGRLYTSLSECVCTTRTVWNTMADAYATVKKGKLRLKRAKHGKSEAPNKHVVPASDEASTEVKTIPPSKSRASTSPHAHEEPAAAASDGSDLGRPSRRPRADAAAAASSSAKTDPTSGSKRAKPVTDEDIDAIVATIPGLTPSQRKLEALRMRQEARTDKDAVESSHKERVAKLNKHLASMPMHFDIPKVAAAGLG